MVASTEIHTHVFQCVSAVTVSIVLHFRPVLARIGTAEFLLHRKKPLLKTLLHHYVFPSLYLKCYQAPMYIFLKFVHDYFSTSL